MVHIIDDLFHNIHSKFRYIYCLVIEVMGFVRGKWLCTYYVIWVINVKSLQTKLGYGKIYVL